jgi:hypothetical protein
MIVAMAAAQCTTSRPTLLVPSTDSTRTAIRRIAWDAYNQPCPSGLRRRGELTMNPYRTNRSFEGAFPVIFEYD